MSDEVSWMQFRFESDALDPDAFRVVDFEGFGEISSLYEFTINLASTDPDVDLDLLSREAARLILARGDQEQKIHGVLAECQQTGTGQNVAYYRVVLVPRLWLLSLQVQNQVHQAQKIEQTLQEELEQSGLVLDEDFAIRLTKSDYPEREYIVQYEESDLDFLCRQMEHYGIFFYFEQGEEKEKLIISDANSAFPEIEGDVEVPYRPATGQSEDVDEVVYSLVCTQKRMPEKVILSDYNYRTPSVPLRVEHVVSANGRGIVSSYGDHFKTPDEGAALAEVRAQEILAGEKTFRGETSVLRFLEGRTYTLEEHPRAELNGHSFLLTSLRREGSQPVGAEAGEVPGHYRSEYAMIPAETVYRPLRKTPKPKLYGVLNAKIDASGSGQYAEIDDQGRYKVKLPFDLTDSGDGQASRFMRKAEPYAGPGYGQHFPLHKGCEVLVTCVDGDPDRPIIANAVPNAEQVSPVTESNQQTSQIRTGGGILMEMDDSAGSERIKMTVPHSETYFHLGAPNQGEPGMWVNSAGLMNLFFGSDINTHTDSNRKDTTSGNSVVEVIGTLGQTIQDTAEEVYNSDYTRSVVGYFQSLKQADSSTKTIGTTNSVKVGQSNSVWVGNKNSASLSADHSETIGTSIALKQALSISHTMGYQGTIHSATEVKKDANLVQTVDSAWSVTVGSAASFDVSGPWIANASNVDIDADSSINLKGGSKVMIDGGGSLITVKGGDVTIKAGKITLDGDVHIKGDLNTDGKINDK